LAVEPKIILLDEPMASMDDESSRAMKEELKRIHRDLKVTIMQVTHNQMEAFSLATRVGIMNRGQIVQVDTVKSLLCQPADEFVARLLGYDNIFRAKLLKNDSGLVSLDVGDILMGAVGHEKDGEQIVGIRPEDVSVSTEPVNPSGMNVLEGIVADTADLGPIVSVSVNLGFTIKASIAKGSFLELNLDKGMRVWLFFKPESVKLLKKHQIASA